MCCFLSNGPATTEIYTLSLHDALPIFYGAIIWKMSPVNAHLALQGDHSAFRHLAHTVSQVRYLKGFGTTTLLDRKSTRLNSSHVRISYAVFCLKKKTNKRSPHTQTNH